MMVRTLPLPFTGLPWSRTSPPFSKSYHLPASHLAMMASLAPSLRSSEAAKMPPLGWNPLVGKKENSSVGGASGVAGSSDSLTACRVTAVILPSVRVPVLSLHTTVQEPSVSTAGSLRTCACRLTMAPQPSERQMVTTMGRPSGMAETAKPTATMRIEKNRPSSGCDGSRYPVVMATTMISARKAMAMAPWMRPNLLRDFCRGVSCSLWLAALRCWAMMPTWVCIPVATTRPLPDPLVTDVEAKHMFLAKASLASSPFTLTCFRMSSLSPVSRASLERSSLTSMRRMSAGTRSPMDSNTRSPGTNSVASISSSAPLRITLHLGAAMLASLASASLADFSM
mmetsp:Transcript_51143/g.128394  ORF Transcript_51143/g.128394 Transcript_51143/m.128394 type:complete len:340 (-) Transcript_51143:822-1841(-)